MTDTYVENILIDKFLDLFSVSGELIVKDFFNKNSEKLKIYGSTEDEFFSWFLSYIQLSDKQKNDEDDFLIENIKKSQLSTSFKKDDNGDFCYSNFKNVAFPNTDFERPTDENGNITTWYELFFITSEPQQIELGENGRTRWTGIMQINICVPKTFGRREVNDRYDEIANLFRSGIILENVRIIKTYRTSALDDDDYYCLPVTISWWADLDR